MASKTGIIKYSIHDNGRMHTGKKRRFNMPALVRLLNSPAVQEAVAKGDVVGYLGHDIRREYGLRPPGFVLVNGQAVPIDPAVVCCHLKAHEDGTIEHQERFLDTPLGRAAEEWHNNQIGGFSSVISPSEESPEDFYGFDYVRAANYVTNKGYAVMDDAAVQNWVNSMQSVKDQKKILWELQQEKQAVFDALIEATASYHSRMVLSVPEEPRVTPMRLHIPEVIADSIDVFKDFRWQEKTAKKPNVIDRIKESQKWR